MTNENGTKRLWIPNKTEWGVCMWVMPSGGFISDGDGYLSMEGFIGDITVEQKMRDAAKHYTGNIYGEPKWFPGYRKISDMEYEDQMARFLDGKIPDEVDEARQIMGLET